MPTIGNLEGPTRQTIAAEAQFEKLLLIIACNYRTRDGLGKLTPPTGSNWARRKGFGILPGEGSLHFYIAYHRFNNIINNTEILQGRGLLQK